MVRHWSEAVPWIWTANWDDTKIAGIVQFRKSFDLDSVPAECPIHVSADTRYRLYVNGRSVCIGPAKSHLGEWNYETIDIAPFCKAGKNVIAARVLRYSPVHPGSMSLVRGIIPGLILHSDSLVRTMVRNMQIVTDISDSC
jgi:alpha-L-rhamnosidase